MKMARCFLPVLLLAAACGSGADAANEGPTPTRDEAAFGDDARAVAAEQANAQASNGQEVPNPTGKSATLSTQGSVDFGSDFFEDFGTNGRTCGTCHGVGEGWSVSADLVRARFDATNGLDPIFRTVDGSNSPNADVSTAAARRQAYSMLINRGTIRVGRPIPANAEFELVGVSDPYGFASAAELSLFRRPLASANLNFASGVMWDGRETQADVRVALSNQANGATLGHAEAAAPLPDVVRTSIVNFETALSVAQLRDNVVGRLDVDGARGGPQALSTQADVAGPFDIYNAWANISGNDPTSRGRRAIARGQALFNNPNAGAGGGACRGCHSVANVGTNANDIFFDIGVSAGARRTPELPLYTLRNKATGATRQTTDPGRALTTGVWTDVDRFKTPNLRALSSRAPYFHNGSAKTLEEVVRFYESSLGFVFTDAERNDLVAFLKAL